MRIEPAGAASGIFGINTISPEIEELCITEGEFDAMAVY